MGTPTGPYPSGSIPAHTGKPPSSDPGAERLGVYPRPHGEAVPEERLDDSLQGLSPPTRGSQDRRGRQLPRRGSIPAHTGKPRSSRAESSAARVYPRPHGEATLRSYRMCYDAGLSPPTRGSRMAARAVREGPRSIPAHTGKPCRPSRWPATSAVYPRPHGEAARSACGGTVLHGLSPPTRGSRPPNFAATIFIGSIPAHTGKPSYYPDGSHCPGVYPRPHGEAYPYSASVCQRSRFSLD